MPRPKIFLSYTKHDETLIRRIAIDLRECQIDAWYDKWEIRPGERLRQRILGEAIPTADAFFVYLTPESIKSKWVQAELDAAFIEEARDKGLPILTFVNSTDTIGLLRPDIAARNCPVISLEHYETGLRQLIRVATEVAGERKAGQLQQQVEYVLRPTLRGITLLDSVKNVGLVDIENRDDHEHAVPPSEFYKLAKKELFISGISAQRSFDAEIQTLRDTLAAGKRLRVLIIQPDSDVVPWLTKREKKDIRLDIEGVIRTARLEGFVDHPNFSMRLMDRFPTFTAIMLDGGIERSFTRTATPSISSIMLDLDLDDSIERSFEEPMLDVQVRIQPTTIYQSHHGGLVIQLKKTREIPFPLFDFVVEELREQWAQAIDLKKS